MCVYIGVLSWWLRVGLSPTVLEDSDDNQCLTERKMCQFYKENLILKKKLAKLEEKISLLLHETKLREQLKQQQQQLDRTSQLLAAQADFPPNPHHRLSGSYVSASHNCEDGCLLDHVTFSFRSWQPFSSPHPHIPKPPSPLPLDESGDGNDDEVFVAAAEVQTDMEEKKNDNDDDDSGASVVNDNAVSLPLATITNEEMWAIYEEGHHLYSLYGSDDVTVADIHLADCTFSPDESRGACRYG